MLTKAKARIITIVARGPNDFDVHEGERYSGLLCWDEMLGQIASITHHEISRPRYQMATPEEWQEQAERRAANRARWEKEAAEERAL